MPIQVQFNSKATTHFKPDKNIRLRLEVKEGRVRVRPTDRHDINPAVHVVEFYQRRQGVAVTIPEKIIQKIQLEQYLPEGAEFSLIEDKYGWYVLQKGTKALGSIPNATVKVRRVH